MSAVQTKSTIETNSNCSAWLRFKMNSKIGLKLNNFCKKKFFDQMYSLESDEMTAL